MCLNDFNSNICATVQQICLPGTQTLFGNQLAFVMLWCLIKILKANKYPPTFFEDNEHKGRSEFRTYIVVFFENIQKLLPKYEI